MTLKSPKTFELTIPSKLEELEAVQNLIAEATVAFGLSEDIAYWMELTISESMINAIRHGNQSDPSKDAYLSISFDGENVEIIVEDQGEGFKLDELADPTQAENLLKPCGRGIWPTLASFSIWQYWRVMPANCAGQVNPPSPVRL